MCSGWKETLRMENFSLKYEKESFHFLCHPPSPSVFLPFYKLFFRASRNSNVFSEPSKHSQHSVSEHGTGEAFL